MFGSSCKLSPTPCPQNVSETANPRFAANSSISTPMSLVRTPGRQIPIASQQASRAARMTSAASVETFPTGNVAQLERYQSRKPNRVSDAPIPYQSPCTPLWNTETSATIVSHQVARRQSGAAHRLKQYRRTTTSSGPVCHGT